MDIKYNPLIILGAPRSGTNILRDVLTAQQNFATWPCDEINYIWRYGNARHIDDEIKEDQLRPGVAKYIRKQFMDIAKKYGVVNVVEKTCANTLRVEYVDKIFPDAIFVNIIRDGRSAVSSAMKRWKAPLDLKYVMKKARYIPARDVPFYAFRYISSHIFRFIHSQEGRVSFWGPRFKNYEKLTRVKSLIEICTLQWQRCVSMSYDYLREKVDPSRYYTLRYENFVNNPQFEVAKLLDYFKLKFNQDHLNKTCQSVHQESITKWKSDLTVADQKLLCDLLKNDLQKFGYYE